MRNVIAIAVPLLVAACGTTPAELRANGKHFTAQTPIAADVAARCLLRDAENGNSDLRGRVMPLEGGGYETLIWHENYSRILAEFRPAKGATTRIDVWFAYTILDVEQDGGQAILASLRNCR